MKRLCPSSCDFCYEFPFPTVAATPSPPRTKTRLVSEGRNVTLRCGQKILHKKGKVYWYKDQEPLEFSYPGYLALGKARLSIIANAVNEGTYTCVVRRHQRVLTTYSWRVHRCAQPGLAVDGGPGRPEEHLAGKQTWAQTPQLAAEAPSLRQPRA
ncbi:Matrix metalloproteinase-23 [Heterocephalus glaber]|uniref:Matrix metalloproteinase-23 n=1 Tax=Heterocephalus glaber TaxID=10181 RepID=G5ATN8_HETGA|nr:Matrix metalloproteinase-23 [Heterocephalus glaber]